MKADIAAAPFPSEGRAHAEVARAIREGRLDQNVPCEVCGRPQSGVGRMAEVVFHHHDYSKPLDVIPLCRDCHRKVHDGVIPEPRTGRFYKHDPGDIDAIQARVDQVLPGPRWQPTEADQAYFANYRPSAYQNPPSAVDVVLVDPEMHVVLVRRKFAPEMGRIALPGVFLGADELLIEACRRAVNTKIDEYPEFLADHGMNASSIHFHLVRVFDDLFRDPRFRVLSFAHVAPVPFKWPRAVSIYQALKMNEAFRAKETLAFDHQRILAATHSFLKDHIYNPDVMAGFFPPGFVIGDYMRVAERILQKGLDPSNFRKKVEELQILHKHGQGKGSYYSFKTTSNSSSY
jgi:8-oxo-dGTP diphosphatase